MICCIACWLAYVFFVIHVTPGVYYFQEMNISDLGKFYFWANESWHLPFRLCLDPECLVFTLKAQSGKPCMFVSGGAWRTRQSLKSITEISCFVITI
jgi:hypothetical protein